MTDEPILIKQRYIIKEFVYLGIVFFPGEILQILSQDDKYVKVKSQFYTSDLLLPRQLLLENTHELL